MKVSGDPEGRWAWAPSCAPGGPGVSGKTKGYVATEQPAMERPRPE